MKKMTKRHQIEKYVAPQHTSQAGLHSSEELRPTEMNFLFISPRTVGWA